MMILIDFDYFSQNKLVQKKKIIIMSLYTIIYILGNIFYVITSITKKVILVLFVRIKT